MEGKSNIKTWVFHSHSDNDYEKVLNSESGTFYVDDHSIVQRFEPANNNPFVDEETEIESNYTYTTHKSIRTFIVPEGVKGFVSGFMRGVRIVDRLVFPDTLVCIGECCFADCILPSVVIPASVMTIDVFAFGHTHIDTLQLPKSLQSPYGRQFKDSYIGKLKLPKEWESSVAMEENGGLRLSEWWFDNDKYGYLRWPSTRIGNLEFY